MKQFISQILFGSLLLCASILIAPGELRAQAISDLTLQGVAAGGVANGMPRIVVNGGSWGTSEIWFAKRDGEDALVFNARSHRKGDGALFVSKTRVVFQPKTDQRNHVNIAREAFKDVKLVDEWVGGGNAILLVRLQTTTEKYLFQLRFTADYGSDGNKRYARPISLFLIKALNDFDAAVKEFNVFTADAMKRFADDQKEPEDADPVVSERYDRFKDMTFIQTSKMRLAGERRSIRVSADYGFSGKTQKTPEKVAFYLHASAMSPIFRDGEIPLIFLVDSKRIQTGEMKLEEEEKTATAVRQVVKVELPYALFQEIANGKTVEFQAGKLEYKLNDTQLETFRKMLSYTLKD